MKKLKTILLSLLLVGCVGVSAQVEDGGQCMKDKDLKQVFDLLGSTKQEVENNLGPPKETNLEGCEFGIKKGDKILKLKGDEFFYAKATPADIVTVKTCTYEGKVIGFETVYMRTDGSFKMYVHASDLDSIKELFADQLPPEDEDNPKLSI